MTIGRIPSVEGGIQPTIVDAKGDLIAGVAADSINRLAVGSNDQVLVADSSTSTGLAWKSVAAPLAAGKNAVINGGMDIWQRGTSFTNPGGAGIYTADRWLHYFNGNATVTRETSIKPDTSTYSMKITATASSASNDTYQLIEEQQMEQFRGKPVTLSVKIAGTTGIPVGLQLSYSTTANDNLFNTNVAISGSVVANPAINTSTFVTYITTFTVPTTAKTLRVGIISGSMVNTNVLYIAEAQLETGLAATLFSKAGGTLQGELAACMRYYYRTAGQGNYAPTGISGVGQSTTTANGFILNPVPMRTNATAIEFSNIAFYDGTNVTALTNMTLDDAGITSQRVGMNAAAGLTQYRPGFAVRNNNAAGYVAFSAEL